MAEPKKKHWIKVKPGHEGKFAAKAKRAGVSTRLYAQKEKDAGGTLGKEANFALNAMNAATHKKRREALYGKKD